jgi:hypothetical protein
MTWTNQAVNILIKQICLLQYLLRSCFERVPLDELFVKKLVAQVMAASTCGVEAAPFKIFLSCDHNGLATKNRGMDQRRPKSILYHF